MEKARRSVPWSMFILMLMVAGGAWADQPVATTTVSATSVAWTPLIDYESIRLTVVLPSGEQVVQQFASGKTPSYQLGSGAADGPYRYELRVAPLVPANVKAAAQAAREKDDYAESRRILREADLDAVPTQSGTLTVKNGMFLSPDGGESGQGQSKQSIIRLKPKTDDQVIPDDLIVQGSACVGLDCVNGESFGFDTLRLKESNTRIKFDDTSSAQGLPNNDWQITANDSNQGGANKFSVEDVTAARVPFTILAGAMTNSLFVDSIGRIGVGTNAPGLDLQPTNGDTPSIRLDQPLAVYPAQAWDIGGNEVNFFVRDFTHGSTLPFRIRPNAPTNSIMISATGDVGVGTATPATGVKLDVQRTDSLATVISATGNNPIGIAILRAQSGNGTSSIKQSYVQLISSETSRLEWRAGMIGTSTYRISDFSSGSEQNRLAITSSGNVGIGVLSPTNPIEHSNGAFLSTVGIWTNGSSRDLKEDICDLEAKAAEETLRDLNPVTFRYRIAPEHPHVGFIAEDVPEMVATEGRKGLSPMDIVAVLTKVVQEQQKTMREQQKAIDQLTAKVEQLEAKR